MRFDDLGTGRRRGEPTGTTARHRPAPTAAGMGVRNILNPTGDITPISSVEVVEVHIGGAVLTIAIDGDAVEISSDRSGLAVLPQASNRVLLRHLPR